MKNTFALTLALMLSLPSLHAQAEAVGDAEAGGKLFKRICGGCHDIGPSVRSSFGPQLNGIFGRTAGAWRTITTPTR